MFPGIIFLISSLLFTASTKVQTNGYDFENIKIQSRIKGLELSLLHLRHDNIKTKTPVLFIHGASFPSALSSGFRINGYSWMDDLAGAGYDVYGLDFLGYGNSNRYKEMYLPPNENPPLGRAEEIYLDIDNAVNFLIKKTGSPTVNIIAHSWGGSVAALYAQKFPDKINKLILYATIVSRNPQKPVEEIIETEYPAYECMPPEKRIQLMKELTPENETSNLENDIFTRWGNEWLNLSSLFQQKLTDQVCFPNGSSVDVNNLLSGKSYFNPELILSPTLIIRGEWDKYPSFEDAQNLFQSLKNVKQKRYVVIERGTHVIHLEKNRFQLYDEVRLFLNEKTKNKELK